MKKHGFGDYSEWSQNLAQLFHALCDPEKLTKLHWPSISSQMIKLSTSFTGMLWGLNGVSV